MEFWKARFAESGKVSQDKKRNHIKGLLVAATDCEPQYIIRLLQTKMRIGLAEQTVLVALAQAAVYSGTAAAPSGLSGSPFEEAVKIVKHVYSVLPIYDKIVPCLHKVGVWKRPEECDFSLGVPIGPMLAKPTKGVSEILNKFEGMEFTCEYKYDGERAQIHCMEDGSVEIYSRNAERNTGKYPYVISYVSRIRDHMGANSGLRILRFPISVCRDRILENIQKLTKMQILEAELTALHTALLLLQQHGYFKVHIDSDSPLAVSLLQSSQLLSHPLFSLIHDCHARLKNLPDTQVYKTTRQANRTAHCLAQHTKTLDSYLHVLYNPPTFLCNILQQDAI